MRRCCFWLRGSRFAKQIVSPDIALATVSQTSPQGLGRVHRLRSVLCYGHLRFGYEHANSMKNGNGRAYQEGFRCLS